MGPISAKTYPGAQWKAGPQRATFEPATGEAALLVSPSRHSASHIRLVERMTEIVPSGRWLVVEDNLSIHTRQKTKLALLAWPEIQIQLLPKYAPWLNLIEPWWKQIQSLGLKGRRFESAKELEEALFAALAYWNAHRHPYTGKKRPQEQVLLKHMLLGGYGVIRDAHA
jgi:transposase